MCSLFVCTISCTNKNTCCGDLYQYPSQEKIDRQVDSVFNLLTTREKIAQIMVINFTSWDSLSKKEIQNRLVRDEKIGGVIPLGHDSLVPAIKRLNQLNGMAQIPMLVSLDAEWGASMRWKDMPEFHYFLQMAALADDSLVYEAGKQMAKECRALKIQVNYTPSVDINNNPDRFCLNFRAFGEQAEKVGDYGLAMMRGLRDGGVAGSAKHFPGHGDTDVDSHLALPLLGFSKERIDSLELHPFKKLIAGGIDMIMVGHMSIPSLDPTGTPSSISKPIVTGLLREELGYNGIIITDALDMHGVSKGSGLEKKQIPLAAFKAGVDILLMPEDVEESITVIEQALAAGEITMEELDTKVKKMLALKSRLGVLDKGYDPIVDIAQLDKFTNTEQPDKLMAEKMKLIDEISQKTMTLLKNDNTKGFGIPVSLDGKKVLYVGYKNPKLGNEFAAIASKHGQMDAIILESDATVENLKEVKEKAKGYDLVIFGFNETSHRRGINFGIIPQEIKFITDWAAQQPMIAVSLGSPYAVRYMEGHQNFTAFLLGYTHHPSNNRAAAQVVFGEIPAVGVLPSTAGEFPAGYNAK